MSQASKFVLADTGITELFTNTGTTLILLPGHPTVLNLFCNNDNGALSQEKKRKF